MHSWPWCFDSMLTSTSNSSNYTYAVGSRGKQLVHALLRGPEPLPIFGSAICNSSMRCRWPLICTEWYELTRRPDDSHGGSDPAATSPHIPMDFFSLEIIHCICEQAVDKRCIISPRSTITVGLGPCATSSSQRGSASLLGICA